MALMHVNFFSQVLGLCCQMDVILPQKTQGIGMEGSDRRNEDGKLPVLWLLHGASDDHTIWQRRTSIERYVAPMGIAVIMPAVQLSFYTNMVHGGRYFDYISEELPGIVREFFPISDKREDNYIAGLSMGGYGSLKIGMAKPEKYSAIGCFSAGNLAGGYEPSFKGLNMDDKILQAMKESKRRRNQDVFGVDDMGELKGTEHDIFVLAEKAIAGNKPLPRIFHACGTEDFLIDNARLTRDWFSGKPFDYTYHEAPGAHTWEFWDEWIQKFLKWLG